MKNLLEEAIVYSGKYFAQLHHARVNFRNRVNKRTAITAASLFAATKARPRLVGPLHRTVAERILLRCEHPAKLPSDT